MPSSSSAASSINTSGPRRSAAQDRWLRSGTPLVPGEVVCEPLEHGCHVRDDPAPGWSASGWSIWSSGATACSRAMAVSRISGKSGGGREPRLVVLIDHRLGSLGRLGPSWRP